MIVGVDPAGVPGIMVCPGGAATTCGWCPPFRWMELIATMLIPTLRVVVGRSALHRCTWQVNPMCRLTRTVFHCVLVTAVAAASVLQVPAAWAADPPQEMFLQIVAHEDDDLIFMNPDLDNTIAAGIPVATVFMTAGQITGDGDTPEARARNRQKGALNAYASMAGLADGDDNSQNEWDGAAWSVGGKVVERYTLRARNTIQVAFMDLRDGELGDLYGGTPQNTIVPSGQTIVSAPQQYGHADAVAVLAAIMSALHPTVVRAQDAEPDRRAGYAPDHADHVAAASFAREATASYTDPLYEVSYRDYNIASVPQNLDTSEGTRKRAIIQKYAIYDTTLKNDLANTGSDQYAWTLRMYYRWSNGTQWTGRNQDGRAQAFVVRNGAVYTYAQTAAGLWDAPLLLAAPGGRLAPGIAVGRSSDGRLAIFAHRLSDHHILALRQLTANGAFGGSWEDLGNPNQGLGNEDNVGTPAVAATADGLLQVFVKNGGGGISTRVQTTSGGWAGWVDMGGTDLQDGLAAVTTPSGAINVFGSTRQSILHWYQQTPNGAFLVDTAFPAGTPASPPSVALNQQGTIDVIYRQPSTSHLIAVRQTTAGTWNPTPVDLGGQGGVGPPGAVTAPSGTDARVMLFERNKGTGVSTARQTAPNLGYGSWTDQFGVVLDYPSAVVGVQGWAIVLTIGTDGVYLAQQVAAGGDQPFGSWEALGM
ncbi:PIG-L family deacetylase [Dactylosporangium sp. CA-092794]|uniref:PIG-L family deacetylase n=1 Tax=Dactylosporangium sp. CA-092794 TaxID=3239929 RepID=UPI003D94D25D